MKYKILIAIFLFGLFLRLYKLNSFPIGFTPDEAAQGYTAYSILKTGRDEWGVTFPINPRSFGDYKSPVQTYLMIPSIAVFGLNEFAVRFPNALLGGLALFVVYFWVKELFGEYGENYKTKLALLSAFLLAINPWHISLSRGAFEANLTTFFLPLGIWLFIRASNYVPTRHRTLDTVHPHRPLISSILFLISPIVLGLNLFTYHSAKIVTPLVFVICYLLFGRRIPIKQKLFSGLVFCLFVVVAFISFSQGGNVRSTDISVFSNSANISAEERYRLALGGFNGIVPRLFHNKLTEPIKEFTQNYSTYLSPNFLFGKGAGEGTYGMTPGFGLFYQVELVFLLFGLLGIALLIQKKQNVKPLVFIVLWILIGFIPASLSRGVGYHANRAVIVLPAFQILIAYGGLEMVGALKRKRKIMILGVVAIYLFSISRFITHYFYYAPVVNARQMLYGWQEVNDHIKDINTTNCPVIMSSDLSEPQAYISFYQKINPIEFQKDSVDWLRYQDQGFKFVDQLGDYRLANYQFRSFGMPEDLTGDCHLLVGSPADFSIYESTIAEAKQNGLILDKMVYYPDTSPAVRVLKIPGEILDIRN